MKKYFAIWLTIIAILALGLYAATSTTTFTAGGLTERSRFTDICKTTITVSPVADDPNTIYSTAESDYDIYADLRRITIAAAGTDTDFTVTLKDSDSVTLFEKTDCNSELLPVSYALGFNTQDGNNYTGIAVTGKLTLDTNDVDCNNITCITVSLYYYEPRY